MYEWWTPLRERKGEWGNLDGDSNIGEERGAEVSEWFNPDEGLNA